MQEQQWIELLGFAALFLVLSGCAVKRSSILIQSQDCSIAIERQIVAATEQSLGLVSGSASREIAIEVRKQISLQPFQVIDKLYVDFARHRFDFLVQKREDNVCALYIFRKIHALDDSALDSFALYRRNVPLQYEVTLPECVCGLNSTMALSAA